MKTALPPIRVSIVDDSIVVRGILTRLLNDQPEIEVVSAAIDGAMAIDHAREHKPDIMVLDIEMPNKDGITALPDILRASPTTKIIMASTLTKRNASISMKALELGASDYLQKPNAGERGEMDRFSHELISKIMALSGRLQSEILPAATTTMIKKAIEPVPAPMLPPVSSSQSYIRTHKPLLAESPSPAIVNKYPTIAPRALAIASSTGGPQALTSIFKELHGYLQHIPVFITQHMPPAFTTILATNLESISGKPCKEAHHNEAIVAGHTYIAPGDYHMTFMQHHGEVKALLNQGEMVNYCRPSADPMVKSLVDIYGERLMLLVLTGMGQDGLAGAKLLHSVGGSVVVQHKESCVVWGMPKAVYEAGLAQSVLPLQDIPNYLKQVFGGRS